ncbi:MAG: 23S rRNA (pseudouridine(1915)-N(3))-methyltransferase RlmH [Clostridia bacterium]|nr:23S rRNA (pseudouridine(1915)-N(3))-methyltransferase RlmH [Clostridia bacterium]
MKKIRLVVVGKLKEKFFADACAEYLKRLSRFADVSVVEIKDRPDGIALESSDVLDAVKGYIALADLGGESMTSEQFSAFLMGALESNDTVSFVIGGSCGVDGRVKAKANKKICFGKMTYPHMLMRVILLEQIYRAFTIKEGLPYHK